MPALPVPVTISGAAAIAAGGCGGGSARSGSPAVPDWGSHHHHEGGGGQEDLGEEKVGRIATLPTTDGYLVRETMVVVWPPLARWPNVFTFLFYLVFFFFPSRFMYTPPFRITRPR